RATESLKKPPLPRARALAALHGRRRNPHTRNKVRHVLLRLLALQRRMSSDCWIIFLAACTAAAFNSYERTAPSRSVISSTGLMAGYATYPLASASGCPG